MFKTGTNKSKSKHSTKLIFHRAELCETSANRWKCTLSSADTLHNSPNIICYIFFFCTLSKCALFFFSFFFAFIHEFHLKRFCCCRCCCWAENIIVNTCHVRRLFVAFFFVLLPFFVLLSACFAMSTNAFPSVMMRSYGRGIFVESQQAHVCAQNTTLILFKYLTCFQILYSASHGNLANGCSKRKKTKKFTQNRIFYIFLRLPIYFIFAYDELMHLDASIMHIFLAPK